MLCERKPPSGQTLSDSVNQLVDSNFPWLFVSPEERITPLASPGLCFFDHNSLQGVSVDANVSEDYVVLTLRLL